MTHWSASVLAILLAGFPGVVSAQVDCNAVPHEPARADCRIGLSCICRGQSDVAAGKGLVQSTPRATDKSRNNPFRAQVSLIGGSKESLSGRSLVACSDQYQRSRYQDWENLACGHAGTRTNRYRAPANLA